MGAFIEKLIRGMDDHEDHVHEDEFFRREDAIHNIIKVVQRIPAMIVLVNECEAYFCRRLLRHMSGFNLEISFTTAMWARVYRAGVFLSYLCRSIVMASYFVKFDEDGGAKGRTWLDTKRGRRRLTSSKRIFVVGWNISYRIEQWRSFIQWFIHQEGETTMNQGRHHQPEKFAMDLNLHEQTEDQLIERGLNGDARALDVLFSSQHAHALSDRASSARQSGGRGRSLAGGLAFRISQSAEIRAPLAIFHLAHANRHQRGIDAAPEQARPPGGFAR